MNTGEMIYEQVKTLPEPLAREVLDFVGYLAMKTQREEVIDLIAAQQASLDEIWDSTEDDVWNHVYANFYHRVAVPGFRQSAAEETAGACTHRAGWLRRLSRPCGDLQRPSCNGRRVDPG